MSLSNAEHLKHLLLAPVRHRRSADPEPKAEASPEASPEPKAEAKPEANPEPKADPKAEAKPDAKAQFDSYGSPAQTQGNFAPTGKDYSLRPSIGLL